MSPTTPTNSIDHPGSTGYRKRFPIGSRPANTRSAIVLPMIHDRRACLPCPAPVKPATGQQRNSERLEVIITDHADVRLDLVPRRRHRIAIDVKTRRIPTLQRQDVDCARTRNTRQRLHALAQLIVERDPACLPLCTSLAAIQPSSASRFSVSKPTLVEAVAAGSSSSIPHRRATRLRAPLK